MAGKMTETALSVVAESLAFVGSRAAHCAGVRSRSEQYSGGTDFDSALALLHDVGYGAPDVGVHALDGARLLRDRHPQLAVFAPFVAWHSNAAYEYARRGLSPEAVAAEFPRPLEAAALSLLWVSDFTTGPQGQPVTISWRLASIRERYGPSSPVMRALDDSLGDFWQAVASVEARFGVSVPR